MGALIDRSALSLCFSVLVPAEENKLPSGQPAPRVRQWRCARGHRRASL